MNLWKRFLCLSAFAFMMASCDQSSIFGGGTEGEGLTGTLVDQQGIPAANVVVTLYAVNYLPGNTSGDYSNIKLTTRTDTNGRFSFSNITSGQYNILGKAALPVLPKTGGNSSPSGSSASNDSLFCFHDSISISNMTRLAPDTLRPPGSLTGKVLLQPDDDSRTTTIQVFGTDYRSDVDSSGTFTLKHLGQGTYRFRAITPLTNYSQLFKEINCRSGRNDTLPSPLFPHCSAPRNHFPLDSSTVALWTFSSYSNGTFKDWSPNGFSLSNANNFALTTSPYDSAAVFTGASTYLSRASTPALTIAGTGKMTFEARIFITQYPSTSNAGGESAIIGTYEGIRMNITGDGTFTAGAQKVSGGVGYWDHGRSSPGAVPLNRWVDLAVAYDNSTGQCYGYIDGIPIQLYVPSPYTLTTDPWRTSTSVFCVGGQTTDNQPFNGKIEEIRVSNNLVLGAGLPLIAGTPPAQTHFSVNSSTVALWTFSTHTGNTFTDLGPNGFSLSNANNFALSASPYDSAVVFTGTVTGSSSYASHASATALTIAGTGKITLEARVFLSQYPSTSNFNKCSLIMGTYEGPHMVVYSDGTLMGGGQKLDSTGTGYWYGPVSDSGVVPLNRWVDLAVALDQSNGQAYGYIDGIPVQLYTGPGQTPPDTQLWRASTSSFTVGNNSVDKNPFAGKIDEIRISNSLILGTGLPVAFTTRPLP